MRSSRRGKGACSSERTGWLTPYEVETLFSDALWAGRGSRLDVRVPARTSEAGVTWIRAAFRSPAQARHRRQRAPRRVLELHRYRYRLLTRTAPACGFPDVEPPAESTTRRPRARPEGPGVPDPGSPTRAHTSWPRGAVRRSSCAHRILRARASDPTGIPVSGERCALPEEELNGPKGNRTPVTDVRGRCPNR